MLKYPRYRHLHCARKGMTVKTIPTSKAARGGEPPLEGSHQRMLLIRRSTSLSVTAAIAAVTLVAGCSSSPGPSDEFLDAGVTARVLTAVQALDYPFESDPSYAVRMGNLQTRLINECVAAQGLPAPTVPDLPLETSSVTVSQSRLWLLPSDDYGISAALYDPQVLAQLRHVPEQSDEPDLPSADAAAYDEAVYGPENERLEFPTGDGKTAFVPVGGCFGQATETMYGVDAATYERAYYAVPNLREVMRTLTADEGVRTSMSSWSSCMKRAGYRVQQPDDLYGVMNDWIAEVVEGTGLVGAVAEAESQLAAADLACRTESGFGTAVSMRFLEIAEAEIAEKEGVAQEYRSMIEHAQGLLAEG